MDAKVWMDCAGLKEKLSRFRDDVESRDIELGELNKMQGEINARYMEFKEVVGFGFCFFPYCTIRLPFREVLDLERLMEKSSDGRIFIGEKECSFIDGLNGIVERHIQSKRYSLEGIRDIMNLRIKEMEEGKRLEKDEEKADLEESTLMHVEKPKDNWIVRGIFKWLGR